MFSITVKRGYMAAFDDLVQNAHCDYLEVSKKLALFTTKVVAYLPFYLDVIEDTKGRTDDVAEVIEIVEQHLTNKELIVTTGLLTILKDLSIGGTMPYKDIADILVRIEASEKVVKYKGYYPIEYKSDIARSYMETLRQVYEFTVTERFTPYKLQVSHKKSLDVLTDRVINDINAYIEVLEHTRDMKDEIDKVLYISTQDYSNSFTKVDQLLRLFSNVDNEKTLTIEEIQKILINMEASTQVINYIKY